MTDRFALKLVGLVFAGVTIAVMLATAMVEGLCRRRLFN
jgi:hypothetical protein